MPVTQSADWNTLRNKPTVVTSFNGSTGAVTGVASFNGSTGAVNGVSSVNGNTGAVSAAQVVAATASVTIGDVGTYLGVFDTNATVVAVNATTSGGNLRKVAAGSTVAAFGFGGTWKNMGGREDGNGGNTVLYLRIA